MLTCVHLVQIPATSEVTLRRENSSNTPAKISQCLSMLKMMTQATEKCLFVNSSFTIN